MDVLSFRRWVCVLWFVACLFGGLWALLGLGFAALMMFVCCFDANSVVHGSVTIVCVCVCG